MPPDPSRRRILKPAKFTVIPLCWVADRLDDDLRRLIEHLNEVTEEPLQTLGVGRKNHQD
jgi:hypothetical protein